MGIISRLLLLLYVLAVMAALVVGAGVCLHFIPTQVWQSYLNWIISTRETIIVIAVMFLASLCLLFMTLSSKKRAVSVKGDVELQKGTFNEVKIAVPAIVSVVERAALSVQGVRQVDAKVQNQGGENPVNVQISIVLGQNYSAPEVSALVKSEIQKALQTALQISNVPIDVKVTEVTHAVVEREKRVV
jgi:uncharacterized alkaline shock family protein YloU